jgi:hypothetical protein
VLPVALRGQAGSIRGVDMTARVSGAIVAYRPDRLGGRINALVNAMRLSSLTGAPLEVVWHQDSGIGRPINDPREMFAPGFVAEHFRLQEGLPRKDRRGARFLQGGLQGLSALCQHLEEGNRVLVDNPFELVLLAGEDPKEVRRQVATIWRDMPFSDTVRDAADQLRPKLGEGAVCYHIRRGDIVQEPSIYNRPWPGKYVVDEFYATHLERVTAEGLRPILLSDDPETILRFRNRFPGVVAFEDLLADLPPLTEGQRDLTELIAISHCASVIAPAASALSYVGARLGDARRVNVELDLRPEEEQAVRTSLMKRLSTPSENLSRPGVAGDAGQALWHLERVMRAVGQADAALPAITAQVEAGLDVSFLYPMLMRLQLEGRDPDAALQTRALARQRVPFQPEDIAQCDTLAAVAHALRGEGGKAASMALRAFWHHCNASPNPREPEAMLAPEVIGLMIDQGMLDPADFLPLSPVAVQLARVPSVALGMPGYGFLRNLWPPAPVGPMTLPDLTAIGWDWHLFMGGVAGPRFAGNRSRSDAYGFLLAEVQLEPSPDALSLLALHDALAGDAAAALGRIGALASDCAGDAIVLHRLSVCALLAKEPARARLAAGAACEAAPDVPALRAWRGQLSLRAGAVPEALADLEAVATQGWSIPPLHLLIAEAAAGLGRTDRQREALEAALTLSPHWAPALMARAAFHAAQGDRPSALADLDRIEARTPGHRMAAELRGRLIG